MSDNIEHRAFWNMDDDGYIGFPIPAWMSKLLPINNDEAKRIREERFKKMTSAFDGPIMEEHLRNNSSYNNQ